MEHDEFRELREIARETNEKVGQIHTTIFGAEGQGGILRDVAELKKHKEEINNFKAKAIGVLMAASAIASFIGSKASALFNAIFKNGNTP